ncbi:MAG: hypothetical protein HY646_10155 [Acidobacteria bacterium]|nr:hypothetical protein [Acidobacteriota bacterium]
MNRLSAAGLIATPADRAAILLMDREGVELETLAGRDRRIPQDRSA